jgi:hypothetical protein
VVNFAAGRGLPPCARPPAGRGPVGQSLGGDGGGGLALVWHRRFSPDDGDVWPTVAWRRRWMRDLPTVWCCEAQRQARHGDIGGGVASPGWRWRPQCGSMPRARSDQMGLGGPSWARS